MTLLSEQEASVLTHETVGGLRVEKVESTIPYVNIMIYGESGVGKTVLAGSAQDVPQMTPVLMLNLEGGTLSLRNTYPDVKVVRITSWPDLQAVYDEIILGKTPWRTIILDSLSEYQKVGMANIMARTVAEHEDREWEVPAQREWGISLAQMRKFVRALRDAPVNAIFTALADERQDKRSGLWKTRPALDGKAANEVPGFLDEVYYYYIKRVDDQNKRFLLTDKTDTVTAKSRAATLPRVVEAPTMQLIYDAIVVNNRKVEPTT